jgi:hypothetical protein
MANGNDALQTAMHNTPAAYYSGGSYALNMSFDTLRDKQWQRVIELIWQHPALYGPLAARYHPNSQVAAQVQVQAPPPTATITQHGQMQVENTVIGIDVQATRSLFECVSILVPVGMFAGIEASIDMRSHYPELKALDDIFYDIALAVYDLHPFQIAAVGYERECQLPMELSGDAEVRRSFFATGNSLIQESVLRMLGADDAVQYDLVRPNLRWLPPNR